MKKAILSPLCSLTLCLSAVLLIAGLAAQIARAFVPNVILPPLDIPTLAALSLIALVLEAIFFGQQHRFWATSLIVGIVDFGLLSLCAGQALTPLVEAAVGIIQAEFPFLEGLDELAERLEVSKAHLIRTFTRQTGVSPGRYITHLRLEYAKLLLRGEDPSITYVAEASGFANANYFAKAFRRETGMSPSEYMESVPQQDRKAASKREPFLW